MDVHRDAAGLIDGARLFTEDGDEIGLRLRRARGGFWVPMGSGGPPPVMSAYDDAAGLIDGERRWPDRRRLQRARCRPSPLSRSSR